jgi:AbrB family looped-hinge helix DNA binding protein
MPISMANRKIIAMKLHLDKSGRIVLPKSLRHRLGLRPGSTLEATETAGGLLLRPIHQGPSLVERDGLLVHTARIDPAFDWRQFSDDLEQERARDILGELEPLMQEARDMSAKY